MNKYLEFNYDETTSAMDIFSQNDIIELYQWTQNLDKTKLVPKDLSDKQLVLFYSANSGDVEQTKECIENYYSCRKKAPELFNHRVITAEEFKATKEAFEFFILPGKSIEGYDMIFHGIHDPNSSKFTHATVSKTIFMTIDLCLAKRGPQSGYMFVFDMKGINFWHLTKVSITTLRKFCLYMQKAIPIRLKAIHILNSEPVLDKIVSLVKPFIDKKYIDMTKFHHKNEDPEKIFEIIPRSSLPSNYGGTLPDTQTLHKENMEELKILEPYFTAEEEQRNAVLRDK